MKIKVFVNWNDKEIISQKESEVKLASCLKDQDSYKDYHDTYLDDIIEEWLDDKNEVHLSEYYKKIFELSAEERAEIETKCRNRYEEQVKQDFSNDWDEVEIEV